MTKVSPYPLPPEDLRVGLGVGDFYKTGETIVTALKEMAQLSPSDRILDVGCGLGRVAWPLARELGPDGRYDGFDTAAQYIEWCTYGLPLDPQRMNFHHFDIYSSVYNTTGKLTGENLIFPWPDETFTLAIATSLFTHLSAAGTVNYLREIRRTLRKGGRLFASFFVLDRESLDLMATRETSPAFVETFAEGRISDPASPDAAIAFNTDWLERMFRESGYTIDTFVPGLWRQPADGRALLYQDVFVVGA
jgi:SAM-dependent methyltransferase